MTLSRSLETADAVVVVSDYMRDLLVDAAPPRRRLHLLARPIRDLGVLRRAIGAADGPCRRRLRRADHPREGAGRGHRGARARRVLRRPSSCASPGSSRTRLLVALPGDRAVRRWPPTRADVTRCSATSTTTAPTSCSGRADVVTIPSPWPEPARRRGARGDVGRGRGRRRPHRRLPSTLAPGRTARSSTRPTWRPGAGHHIAARRPPGAGPPPRGPGPPERRWRRHRRPRGLHQDRDDEPTPPFGLSPPPASAAGCGAAPAPSYGWRGAMGNFSTDRTRRSPVHRHDQPPRGHERPPPAGQRRAVEGLRRVRRRPRPVGRHHHRRRRAGLQRRQRPQVHGRRRRPHEASRRPASAASRPATTSTSR